MDYFMMQIFFLPGLSLSQCYWGVCLSLPPALTPGISTGAASLPGDNNPKYLPRRRQKSIWDYYIIQGDNPVYSVVKKWGEVSFRNLVDGWTEWEGTARGGAKCRVSLGDEVASTVLDWAVLAHKKRLRGAANYRPNFLDIFVLYFLSFMAAPIWSVALKEKARLLGNRLNCPAFATAIATAEPP